jgi:UDP-GlcNAc:undecaprenyl-phosphate GlcNAc-1-phosphate transferase
VYSLFFLAVVSFGFSLLLTPAARDLFLRFGVVDHPDETRKLHARPIPRVGGIAIALAYLIAFGLLLLSDLKAGTIVWSALPLIWKLIPAAGLVFLIGLLDDLRRLRPWQKLMGQIAAATMVYFAGVQVVAIGGSHHMAWWLAFPATIAWLVACSNAVNLLDGIDGLAAGVGFVATITMVVASVIQHNFELAMATVPLAACLLAFLRYNFNPATIFLGDCGSLFIGFLLGCYGILWSQKSATVLGMTAPLMALAIPLLDTAIAIVRRFLRGQPIFGADRGHIHHRLLDHGLTPRRAALLLYGVGILAAMFSLFMATSHLKIPVIVAFCAAAWVGIQRLGYVEFDTVGRLLLTGSFRKLLRSHISLCNFETSLSGAQTPDECWNILKNTYHEFGFCRIHVELAGRSYREERAKPDGSRTWRVEISLSATDFVHLAREFNATARHNAVAAFADSVRKILESKIPGFAPYVVAPEFEFSTLKPITYRVASTGN